MADAPTWDVLDAALRQALDLDGDQRTAYLASLDAATRVALAPLLRDALADDPLLDHPEAVLAGLATEAPGLNPGLRLGPYRIDALVGEGGMGRVYRAHRADGAYEQTVALKVVRQSLALAGADVLARFRRERDVLATLDHPGIARLVDGGQTDDGVPYLVTEFVDGHPITDWVVQRDLDVSSRVRLIASVAQAIGHAHRRLVVHRDLKPSNVLVTERDGQARPVVLDFGVAKLIDDSGMGADALTHLGTRPLTPAYAAPELMTPGAPVTTAVDVYGLGALLYEVLTGARSSEAGTDLSGAEPVRPSRVVASRPALSRALRGDLDTICLKALASDPTRRYVSADDFADDLERHLERKPVRARPDTIAYTLGRLARRHRVAVAASVVALAALVGGLGASLVAIAGERQARAEAETAAIRATEAATLLGNLFEAADPASSGGVTTIREALGDGLAQVSEVRSEVLRGHLLGVLGQTYWKIGEWQFADSLLAVSFDVLDRSDASTPRQLTDARIALAYTRVRLDDAPLARALYLRAISDLRQSDTPDARRLAQALAGLSTAERSLWRTDEAYRPAAEAVEVARDSEDPELLAAALLEYGYTLAILRRDDESLRAIRESLQRHRALYGDDDQRTVRVRLSLGRVLLQVGQADEAGPYLRSAKTYYTDTYGHDHPTVADLAYDLGRTRLLQQRYAQAGALIDSALVAYREIYASTDNAIVPVLSHYALALNALGQYVQAEAAAREALDRQRGTDTGDNPIDARSWAQVGLALVGQGKPADAEPYLERALAAFEAPSAQRYIEPYDPVGAVRQALLAGRRSR